jgi:hypothetical protein
MSQDGQFWLDADCWGSTEGTDMFDARIYRWRWAAEHELKKLDKPASVFEIGLYNNKPVMLIDAYRYWLDAKYAFAGKKISDEKSQDDRRYMPPEMR